MSALKGRPETDRPPRKPRIETQIHRRKKAKAVLPLTAEWDADSGETSTGLRTPSDRMRKSI
ncbi:MAG TPA: hypothetical protein VGQ60_05215 [Nitrospiraceae bacterium]|nr:hypothetical protein [Nitrospiraceae bacterium]